ncbi:hypothetical protein A3D00_05705 [Candidatus Woesebacteria bacterium RIFCSPHIGHO2_02_FULL_38_9]|uniref:5'-3' exonuclease domain-containing protein n=1 Tax=Candidatus Woesebacteria bacterium RIFCSPHIGHO2_01_FULL_39_28 TaxID=1802496 RepID=A0A1F7YKM8_9BACT|nr:MAG: hypothetical protein A2627_01900 [Candidatus Woesebacteria bacterium RIFCSPHIGHO2_01_FULL_39_28]OGM34259.1 MAG: hypothetical protein A3D00_05705 [Candidatus Woesebacteria bacterium RIFCSPHIGHO2_02_FULL_38_9]OGM57027.1 MAG: hypothetical protein A3A50_03525 [Candidatus Woesebacteria bacterium RIFCSPLOWO2_01_FULL_38_20]
MKKLVLIDGNAILHRAFHALPPLTTKSGQPINAVYGLVSMLLRVITDLKPTHIIVVFDTEKPTFRHKEFVNYQAQRPKMASELSGQFDKAKRVLQAFGIPIYSKEGFEADDVIGTIARQVTGLEVVIVTGDRDILQLVSDHVKLYMPIVGLASAKLFGKNEVIEKMGVPPEQISDFKALVGDPSDNYPGVAGIGPKTAISLLSKYNNLENIYKNLESFPKAVSKKLTAGKDSAFLSQKLAKIVTDVSFDFNIDKADHWDVDSDRVLSLFSEFGFKTLTDRIKKIGKQIDESKQISLL